MLGKFYRPLGGTGTSTMFHWNALQLLVQHAESMGLSALIARGLASHAARIALRKGQPEAAAAFEPTRHVPNLWRMPMEENALAQLLRATRG